MTNSKLQYPIIAGNELPTYHTQYASYSKILIVRNFLNKMIQIKNQNSYLFTISTALVDNSRDTVIP